MDYSERKPIKPNRFKRREKSALDSIPVPPPPPRSARSTATPQPQQIFPQSEQPFLRPSVLEQLDQLQLASEARVPEGVSKHDQLTMVRLATEVAKRKMEAIYLYRPLPMAEKFHACDWPERLLTGSNRAAKTCSSIAEIARAFTGQDPYGKYPKRDGRAIIVGKDETMLAEVIWRYLYFGGAFRIIRDAITQEWRTVKPWEEGDRLRRAEWRAAPPFLPRRMIKSVSWKNKKKGVPGKLVMKNGWEAVFFSGNSDPLPGTNVDIVYFSEEIENERWYPEMAMRLLDRKGKFIWDTTPELGTAKLYDLYLESQKPGVSRIKHFHFLLKDNPYLDQADKDLVADKFKHDPRALKSKVYGEFVIAGAKVFFEFMPEAEKCPHLVDTFKIPDDWTRYVAVDPGNQKCMTLFLAVPPEDEEERTVKLPGGTKYTYPWGYYIYDEIHIEHCTAAIWASAFAIRCQGQQIERMIIDHQRGRVTDESSLAIEDQYLEALEEHGFRARHTGWEYGCNNPHIRVERIHHYMEIGKDLAPKLYFLKDSVPLTIFQMDKYRQATIKGVPKYGEDGRPKFHKKDDDAVDCVGYLCAADPEYVRPPRMIAGRTWEQESLIIRKKLARAAREASLSRRPTAGVC